MADTRENIPSIADRARRIDAGAPIVAAHFLSDLAVLVLGEEALLLVGKDERRVPAHGGGILCTAANARRVLTGGDDGKVVATDADGASTIVATDQKRRWIDHVALGPSDAVAWSAGKQAFVQAGKGGERTMEAPSTVGGLAFAPKGVRLVVAHYNGVTLWFPNAKSEPERLEWKGSHLGAMLSPDGKFLVTTMQEPMLHGWRLEDRKDMRMSGYGARVRSLSWSADGKWLATSGSNQLILWPFQGKDGPMGKAPRILAPAQPQAEVVACHPKQDIVAVGYADGLVLLVRIADGAEILARKGTGAPITAMAWNTSGTKLVVGAEDGAAVIIDLG
ncbi:MAG: WD40 repeat domain-containing protein [Hyphomicrobiales bacterium]|nr:WD40 repeat domain-containing protein [Hyphomicrobiales bacterium]